MTVVIRRLCVEDNVHMVALVQLLLRFVSSSSDGNHIHVAEMAILAVAVFACAHRIRRPSAGITAGAFLIAYIDRGYYFPHYRSVEHRRSSLSQKSAAGLSCSHRNTNIAQRAVGVNLL